jgi:phosphatidylglycerol lysyltransferase
VLSGSLRHPSLFLSACTLAATLGILSLIPGGIGVFDAALLVMLTRSGAPAESVAAGLLIFRLVYYLVPWLIGLYLGSGLLTRADNPMLTRLARQWHDHPLLGLLRLPLHVLATIGVRLLGVLTFATGLVLLVSAALPALENTSSACSSFCRCLRSSFPISSRSGSVCS